MFMVRKTVGVFYGAKRFYDCGGGAFMEEEMGSKG